MNAVQQLFEWDETKRLTWVAAPLIRKDHVLGIPIQSPIEMHRSKGRFLKFLFFGWLLQIILK